MPETTTTLAEYVSHGWKMGLFCASCREPVATLTGEDIMDRFGANLLATVEDMCSRVRCPTCGHLGAWETSVSDVSPEVAVAVGRGLGTWVARDLYLRQVLAAHGRPLEIADVVWARMEAFGSEHPHWEPRQPGAPGCPLSAAGEAALDFPPRPAPGSSHL